MRKMDLYANPINLTFNHEKKYKTAYGGFFTLLTAFVLITWVLSQLAHAIHKDFVMTYTQHLT